jgi:hypothetical protein
MKEWEKDNERRTKEKEKKSHGDGEWKLGEGSTDGKRMKNL